MMLMMREREESETKHRQHTDFKKIAQREILTSDERGKKQRLNSPFIRLDFYKTFQEVSISHNCQTKSKLKAEVFPDRHRRKKKKKKKKKAGNKTNISPQDFHYSGSKAERQ